MIRLKQVLRYITARSLGKAQTASCPRSGQQFSVLGKLTVTGLFCALLILTITSCSNGSTDPGGPQPQTISYSGVADGVLYTLEITENSAGRAYAPQSGDTYVLTVYSSPIKKSSGTITVGNSGVLTLAPTKDPGKTFKITVDTEGITAMNGTITFEDGSSESAPASLKQLEEGDPSTLTITGLPSQYNGNYVWGELNGHDISFILSWSAGALSQIKDGKVILYVYENDAEYNFSLYTGNETFAFEDGTKGLFEIVISSSALYTEDMGYYVAHFYTKKDVSTTFSGGTATLSYSDLEAADF